MIVPRGCGHAALLWHCRLWRGRRPGITGCSSTGFGSDQKSCNFFYPPPLPPGPRANLGQLSIKREIGMYIHICTDKAN